MEKLRNLWYTTKDELLNKVSWPTWDELMQSTKIVLVASLVFAAIIYILDKTSDLITGVIYKFLT
ncbi:MAG: preprotein translocase subunit SecE [Flavobacteriales bacterium]|nr:preprotein translocase subunit SecE [Flavobacteriales bacterium]